MKAFAFRDGRIKFGASVAPGAIQVCSGNAKIVHEVVTGIARHGSGKDVLLVPGLPEAETPNAAVSALTAFAVACAQRIEKRKMRRAGRGA